MKIYPNSPNEHRPDGGFTADEIKRGVHWISADVECEECGKVQSVPMAGSVTNGKCIACGGKTS